MNDQADDPRIDEMDDDREQDNDERARDEDSRDRDEDSRDRDEDSRDRDEDPRDRDDARADDEDRDDEPRERRSHDGGNGARRRRRRRRPEDDYQPDDDRAIQALEFVSSVLKEMEVDCRARLRRPKEENSEAEINIEIYGKDSGRIIGKKGQVLAALQFLVHRVVNRPGLDRRHILVDAEGYRSRRDSSLANMARRLGKQAVAEGKIITFEPMNPRDRRVVHLALAKFEGVITKSDGEGDDRRVQIIPVRRG